MSAQKEILGAVGAGISAAGAFGSIGHKLTDEQRAAKKQKLNARNQSQAKEADARRVADAVLKDKKEAKKVIRYAKSAIQKAIKERELKKDIAMSQSAKKMKREAK